MKEGLNEFRDNFCEYRLIIYPKIYVKLIELYIHSTTERTNRHRIK